jgi:hypothetical protein
MPDIFIANHKNHSKKEDKTAKQKKYSWEEELPVMLHSEEILKVLRREVKEMNNKGKTLNSQEKLKTPVSSLQKSVIISNPAGIFTAYKLHPKGLRFQEQDENEEILLLLRKHFITNFPWIFLGVIFLIFPLFIIYLLNFSNLLTAVFKISANTLFILIYSYYLLVFCYLFVNYITWYYNVALITNKKIVDVHFQDIIYHDVAMTKLNLIEDINYVQSGFFPSLFGYGDVYIETAGKSLSFHFNRIPNPEKVVDLLENLIGGAGSE